MEANAVRLDERTLLLRLLNASGASLREALERMVDLERTEYYGLALFLRRDVFREVMRMKRKRYDENTVDLMPAIEDVGIANVIEAVISKVGIEHLIDKIGSAALADKIDVNALVDKIGVTALADKIGVEELRRQLARLEAGAD